MRPRACRMSRRSRVLPPSSSPRYREARRPPPRVSVAGQASPCRRGFRSQRPCWVLRAIPRRPVRRLLAPEAPALACRVSRFRRARCPARILLPSSPTHVLSLGNRVPALAPHAVAHDGVPDTVSTIAPAMEPRFGGAALGVPESPHAARPAASSPYYFLRDAEAEPDAPRAKVRCMDRIGSPRSRSAFPAMTNCARWHRANALHRA